MSAGFRLDERAIALLARNTEVVKALVDNAGKIADEAKALAAREFHDTGDYMNGIGARKTVLPGGTISGQVLASDWKSHWAEFGWTDEGGTHHPPKAILRRGAEAAGFTPKVLPK